MNKLIKYGWWVLIITSLMFAFGVYVNNGYRFDNLSHKTNNSICPDNFKNSEEKTTAFENWINDFYDNNPNATIAEMSKARRNFYIKNNCTEALKRYEDYKAGNVDKETQQNIERIIKEEVLKNKEKQADLNKEITKFSNWIDQFFTANPGSSLLQLIEARSGFRVSYDKDKLENNFSIAPQIFEDFLSGKVDKKTQKSIENIIRNYFEPSTDNNEKFKFQEPSTCIDFLSDSIIKKIDNKIWQLLEEKKYQEVITFGNQHLNNDCIWYFDQFFWVRRAESFYALGECQQALKAALHLITITPKLNQDDEPAKEFYDFIQNSSICRVYE